MSINYNSIKDLTNLLYEFIRSKNKFIFENYEYMHQQPFEIPFHVINGSEDQSVSLDDVQRWQKESTLPCQFIFLKGGHFYLLDNPADFVKTVFKGAKR
jgi:surfactin synthase thioesterase subunit